MKYASLELGTVEAVFNKLGGMDGAKRFLADEFTLVPKEPKKLLQLMLTVSVAGAEKFVAKEHFKVDTSLKAKVKIAFLWDDFSKHFLPKTEEGVLKGELKVY